MKGTNYLTFNHATMMQIVQEYLDCTFARSPGKVDSVDYDTSASLFKVTVKSDDPSKATS